MTYDVSDDKRRDQVFACCMQQGDHTQYSVFIAELSERELVVFRGALEKIVNHHQDQVLMFDLGPSHRQYGQVIASIGRSYNPPARVLVV